MAESNDANPVTEGEEEEEEGQIAQSNDENVGKLKEIIICIFDWLL